MNFSDNLPIVAVLLILLTIVIVRVVRRRNYERSLSRQTDLVEIRSQLTKWREKLALILAQDHVPQSDVRWRIARGESTSLSAGECRMRIDKIYRELSDKVRYPNALAPVETGAKPVPDKVAKVRDLEQANRAWRQRGALPSVKM
ncbi:MAG: hypothetical protein RJB39_744 [Candidatus Parcubacteria bacterium]|jgi:hypothetical protein